METATYCLRSTRIAGSRAHVWIWARSANRCTRLTTSPACSSCGPRRARSLATGSDRGVVRGREFMRPQAVHIFAVSTLHDLPADRHNDHWKFAVVGVNENGPLYRTNTGFLED